MSNFCHKPTVSDIYCNSKLSRLYLYWKMNCLWNLTSRMSESVSSNSASVSPQKPTIMSVERATPGITDRTWETKSR